MPICGHRRGYEVPRYGHRCLHVGTAGEARDMRPESTETDEDNDKQELEGRKLDDNLETCRGLEEGGKTLPWIERSRPELRSETTANQQQG